MKSKMQFTLIACIASMALLTSCFQARSTLQPQMQIALPTSQPSPEVSIQTPNAQEAGFLAADPSTSFPLAGIHLHYPIQPRWMEALIQSGVRWTRLDIFFWDRIEPVKQDPPVYDWSQVDEASLIRLSENGIQLIAGILYTPEWAQKYPGVACGPVAEGEIDRFSNFMSALVERYSQPPFNLVYWEIGNEPDIDRSLVSPRSGFGCWGETGDPYYGSEYYAQVFKAIVPQIKISDPKAQVLPGGLLLDCDPLHPILDEKDQPRDCAAGKFLEGFLKAGGGAYIDGISFHGYDYYSQAVGQYENPNWKSGWQTTGPVWIAKLAYIKQLLNEAGLAELPIYLTELATICGRDGSEEYCRTQALQQTKAIYAVQSLAAGKAENLRALIWFGIDGWRASGVLQNGAPLPIYHALRFFDTYVNNTNYDHMIQEFPGIQGYAFRQADQEIWVLWSRDINSHKIDLVDIPRAIYNVEGKKMNLLSETIEVTISPIYIFW